MKYDSLIPELLVSSMEKSRAFYVDTLGFKVEYERKENKFIFLSLEGSQLMIQEEKYDAKDPFQTADRSQPFGRGIHFQIKVKNMDIYLKYLQKMNYPIKSPTHEYWFRNGNLLVGMKGFLVLDPDGYLFLFYEDIGVKKIGTE
jgi:lactoylglutathione lyase